MPVMPLGALAVLPFLPSGRGALILIFGGLLVLPFALLLSRGGARPAASVQAEAAPAARPRRPAARPTAAPAWTPPRATYPPPASGPQWSDPAPQEVGAAPPWGGTALERALRLAVGGTRLLAASPGHYVVRLNRCDSCARNVAGCRAERAAIERAVAAYMPMPRVTERACAQRDRQACTFDIRRG